MQSLASAGHWSLFWITRSRCLARLVWIFSAVMVSGRSTFHWPAPAWADAPLPVLLEPERPEDVLVRSPLVLLLERSAVELVPAPVLLRSGVVWPAALPPEVLPSPMPRGVELLLEPVPLLEPLPVLEPLRPKPLPLLPEPLAPLAPVADSRTREMINSGVIRVAGKVAIATPNPF